MAELIVAPLLQVIFEKIADPLIQDLSDFWDLSDRFKKLQRTLPMAQAVIQDAEERQVTEEAVRIWLSQLKDATTKVEDMLEEFMYIKNMRTASYSVNYSKKREILDDLQKVLVEGINLRLAERVGVDKKFDRRETSSFFIGSQVYGREEDKKRILERLLVSSETFVVPIFGTPTIGKTTLAQMVYNDDEVKNHFDLRIWVFVSPDFKVKRTIKAAIESATGNKCELEELDSLQLKLWNILHEKIFLLVLDDVWTDDEDEWDKLRLLFSCGSHGSRILITTCSQKIAMIIGSSDLAYHLNSLSEEDSWALFKKRAFVDQLEEEKHPNLVAVGKEIVRKCEGVPLAVKVVGGLVRFKREEMDWFHVQNSNLWDLRVYRQGVFPALLVSYLHLPPHLKHCFIFCSIFPKNNEIERKAMIHMWMAQGFILSDGESKALEDIGDEYFKELLWMSVLEEIRESEGGPKSLGQVHHASIVAEFDYSLPLVPKALSQSKHLRTLIVLSEGGLETIPIISSFFYLRVLKLWGCYTELPESIGDLSILRYLDLSYGHFQRLPSSISSLHALQVLSLFCCYNMSYLPEQIGLVTGLRHLDICGCEALMKMPYGIINLLHLQTLPLYIVPMHLPNIRMRDIPIRLRSAVDLSVSSIGGSLYDIQNLDLRDELKIKHLERIRCVEEAKAANLGKKVGLRSVGLCWGNEGSNLVMNSALEANAARFQEHKLLTPGPSNQPDNEAVRCDVQLAGEVLEVLHPHKNINKLFVVGYPGIMFPIWTLPNLIKLVLRNCQGCVHLPILGHLPLLKSLHMQGMTQLTAIGQDFYGDQYVAVPFPSLQELVVADFPNLHDWLSPDGKDIIFPVLRKLTLKKCQNLVSFPSLVSLKLLELDECNSAILSCMEELSQLSSLVIDGFSELISLPQNTVRNKPHLECLRISSCPKLESLPSELTALPSLKSLTIRWCEKLSRLPPHGFQSLTSLEMSDCHGLITLPENVLGHLTSLQTLSIENCSLLNSISIGSQPLTALEYLSIMYCPSLSSLVSNSDSLSVLKSLSIVRCPLIESLPDGFKNATQLRSLEIRSSPRMRYLPEWLESFASLRSLSISDCQNLKCLPVGIRRPSKLQHLSILDCPYLQRQCEQERGEDWWKIAHIPHRYILPSHLDQA